MEVGGDSVSRREWEMGAGGGGEGERRNGKERGGSGSDGWREIEKGREAEYCRFFLFLVFVSW